VALVRRSPASRGPGIWAVAGRFSTILGEADIGTGTAPDGASDRRVFGSMALPPRNQAEVANRAAAVWLTPRMDRLFQEVHRAPPLPGTVFGLGFGCRPRAGGRGA